MEKKKTIDKEAILQGFDNLAKAKKVNATNVKLCLLFALAVVVVVLVWGFAVSTTALNKVVVVERSGEYLKTSTASNEELFIALVKNTCAEATKYANSLERISFRNNQAHAAFYINKTDLNAIFQKYQNEKIYNDVLQNGAVYKCELDSVQSLAGQNEPYSVRFTSSLVLYAPSGQVYKYKITTEGQLVKTTPQYPENVTGFFFSRYIQQIESVGVTNTTTPTEQTGGNENG